MNIIFRLADYYFDSAMSYLVMHKADLYASPKVDIPDVEEYTQGDCLEVAMRDYCLRFNLTILQTL